jgi:putative membrane protein insertion efficiency factor
MSHNAVLQHESRATASSIHPGALALTRFLLRRALVLPIDLYAILISPLLLGHYGPSCRFDPPCSAYARAAILRDGLLRGLPLALSRLLRCRPGGAYGFDPLPPKCSGGA